MSGIADYFAMGGYAAYVWPAYGLAIGVLGVLSAQSWRRYRHSRDALDELPAAEGRRR